MLQLRSKIALGQAKEVSAELASEKTPDLVAVKLLADYEQGKDVTSQAKKLAEQHGQENLSVQLLVGIILERVGETEEALALLSKHQGSLDAYVHFSYFYNMNLAWNIAWEDVWLTTEQRSLDRTNTPTTKPHRSRRKRGTTRTEMGTRQLASQHC